MEAPNMVSTKDLAYLTDIFEWNFNASKLANSMLNNIGIESIKEIASDVASLHATHCRKIIEILGGHYE